VVGGYFLVLIIDRDYERITMKKKLTFCLLPEDPPVLEQQSKHTGSPDLGGKIHESMEILLREKGKITKKENLIIRHHDHYLTHSIMVFDPDDEDNAHVRVVEYSRKDMDDWDGKIVFKKAKILTNTENISRNMMTYFEIIHGKYSADITIWKPSQKTQ
jgi:ribosomal protein L19